MRSPRTNVSRLLIVACLAGFAGGCGPNTQTQIIGAWKSDDSNPTRAEFTADGKASLTKEGFGLRGTYKVVGDELEWNLAGATTSKCKVKVTGDELELTPEGKPSFKLKRM